MKLGTESKALATHNLAIIYARSQNHCIGKGGGLPWSLPDEYQHFEHTVSGYPVIMGRHSYEDHEALIPNCLNIVVSTQSELEIEADAYLAANLSDAIKHAQSVSELCFVIGGAALIGEALPKARVVYETVVDAQIDGDTFVNPFDFTGWSSETIIDHTKDDRHAFSFQCLKHTRR